MSQLVTALHVVARIVGIRFRARPPAEAVSRAWLREHELDSGKRSQE